MATTLTVTEKKILDDRAKGKSWRAIGDVLGMTSDEVYRNWVHASSKENHFSESEYRMMQLERLETMVNALWDGMKDGSPDHVKAMLPVIKEISKLLDLNQQKTRIEMRVVEDKQTELIVAYVDQVAEALFQKILKHVTAQKARTEIEMHWPEWVAEASQAPIAAIEQATVEV